MSVSAITFDLCSALSASVGARDTNGTSGAERKRLPDDLFFCRTLAAFQNRHRGEAIVVCGCGESLRGFRPPAGLVTIGVNDVGRQFTPDYLVVVNPPNQFRDSRFEFVKTSAARAIFTQLELGLQHEHVVRFRLGRRGGTDTSDPNILHYTQNSPYVAVCLAALMGAARIGLLGVDFTAVHFFGGNGPHPLSHLLNTINAEYDALRYSLGLRGIGLVNLSPVSRLTSLPRDTMDQFLKPPAESAVSAIEAHTSRPPASPRRVFFVNYRFLSCGDVFTSGLARAAEALGVAHEGASWDDPELPAKLRAFAPDLVFVVHGRRCAQRWNGALREWNSAVWLVDEPYEVDDTARWSSLFQTVFVNDPATLGRHRNAHYLPVCFDPYVHFDSPEPRLFGAGFIGGANPRREQWLSLLAERGLLAYVVGGPWRDPALNKLCRSRNIPASQSADFYRQTKIVINIFRQQHHYNHQRLPATSLNPRIYEALACGALVVSEPRPELEQVCPKLPVFHNERELLDLVRQLTDDEVERKGVQRECAIMLRAHTYAERLRSVLSTCCSFVPRCYEPIESTVASTTTRAAASVCGIAGSYPAQASTSH